jgi:hypothetical protein
MISIAGVRSLSLWGDRSDAAPNSASAMIRKDRPMNIFLCKLRSEDLGALETADIATERRRFGLEPMRAA